jgi:hypothetical protein
MARGRLLSRAGIVKLGLVLELEEQMVSGWEYRNLVTFLISPVAGFGRQREKHWRNRGRGARN